MNDSKSLLSQKKRKILGPIGRMLLKVFNWKIEGEIPDLKKLNLFNKKNYAVFSQKMFMYKLNLQNLNVHIHS